MRGLRGLLAALILAFLTLGPSVESLVCGGEAGLSAAASEAHTVTVQPISHGDDHGAGAADVCIHGHCHHAAPFVPAEVAAPQLVSTHPADHGLEPTLLQTSDPHFGLKRPPRT